MLQPLVIKVHLVEAVQHAQHAAHRVVQAAVDRVEHDHALLDAGQRCADRRVGLAVRQIFHGRADDALACLDEEAQQLEQRRRWRVERQRHRNLAHVVDVQAAFDLFDLRRLDVQRLAAARAALELEHRRHVLDVRAVEQRTQRAGGGSTEAADHLRQADWVRAAPWDERELDDPRHLFAGVVLFVPVAVDAEDLARGLVDRDDVRRGVLALFDLRDRVHLVDGAQTVLVVARVGAAFDLVVGLLGQRRLGLEAGRRQVDVAVHARFYTLLVIKRRDVLDVRLALRAVEVGRCVRQQHVVDHDGEEVRPVATVVPAQLEVLRAAERQLGQHLLQFGAGLLCLHGHLPVHEGGLALGLVDLLLVGVANDHVLDGAIGWPQFLDRSGREVDAGLGQHWVNDL